VEYSWPGLKYSDESNKITIPIKANTGMVDSRKFIHKIIHGSADYRYLPMMYNSAVSRELVDKLRAKAGKVFNSACPDIYTGYCFAYMLTAYLTIGLPLSINGVSLKSNGLAHAYNDQTQASNHFWESLKKSTVQWPAEIPVFSTSYVGI